MRESGLAIPLVLLLFASIWLFPLVTALVAGDIIAAEDHNGTLKTILTRSLDRGQIFAGKLLAAATYAALALVLMGSVAVVAGTLKSGFNPLTSLSGTHVSAGHGARPGRGQLRRLPDADRGSRLLRPPALGAHSKQRGGRRRDAHVRALMQLIGILPGLSGTEPYLLTTQFQAWQGFFRVPTDWAPIVRAAVGVRDLRRTGRARRLPGVRAARRRRRLSAQQRGLTPMLHR